MLTGIRWFIYGGIAFAAGVGLCALAHAATPPTAADVTWQQTTTYADGSAMPLADVAYVTISWSIEGTNAGGLLRVALLPAKLTIPTPCGKYIISGSFTTTASAKVPNATSMVDTKTFDTGTVCPKPTPPGAFIVTKVMRL
jgi:hypothetical protein